MSLTKNTRPRQRVYAVVEALRYWCLKYLFQKDFILYSITKPSSVSNTKETKRPACGVGRMFARMYLCPRAVQEWITDQLMHLEGW